jgi:glycosyltransferase involved in cell wall biosynthesis
MKFKKLANPLLIVGDNPSLPGGLSRSGRDIATLCCTLPQFRVGYMGRGIGNNHKLPFPLYDYPEYGQWGEEYIQRVWEDFSDGQDGIIFSTDDPSRRHWFANPTGLPADTQKFLGDGRNFQKWGYFPIDSTGPNGITLPMASQDCINRYDRVLASSEWGRSVIITGGRKNADWLPHGIWPDKFKVQWRNVDGWTNENVYVGCVMANQSRKDYPAAFECFAALKAHYGNKFHVWVHTDEMIRYWNLYALAQEYGVGDCLEVTSDLTDTQLAIRYSACDCTILPSSGEGFGFPIAESLSCGSACIVTDYAAGPELVRAISDTCCIKPMCYRVDTQHNVRRAVISGYAFAQAAIDQIEKKRTDWEYRSGQIAESVRHLHWPNLKHIWTRWLLDGLI